MTPLDTAFNVVLVQMADGVIIAEQQRTGGFRVRTATGACAALHGAHVRGGKGRLDPEQLVGAEAANGGVYHATEARTRRGGLLLAVYTAASTDEPAELHVLGLALASEIQRVRATRTAAIARRELKRLRGRNGFLIRGVSHDLKNPIGAIDGYVQLLDAGVRGELTDGQREWTGRIGRALQSMLSLINDLLDVARVDSSALTFEKQPLPLAAILREALQSLQPVAEKQGVRIESDIAENLPHALADLSRARQAMDKMLAFALRTTAQDEILRCTMGTDTFPSGAAAVTFGVSFSSCPTDPEQQAKLLDGLVKTEAAPGRDPGTGLELALARRLAIAMNGDLAFTSNGDAPALVLYFPAADRR